jgi:hypothetical protein
MLDRNLGLEIVAIHPDSAGILSFPIKTTAKNRIIVITGLDPVIHLPLKIHCPSWMDTRVKPAYPSGG